MARGSTSLEGLPSVSEFLSASRRSLSALQISATLKHYAQLVDCTSVSAFGRAVIGLYGQTEDILLDRRKRHGLG